MTEASDAASGFYLIAVAGGALVLFAALLYGTFQRRRRRQELNERLPGEDPPR